MSQVKEALAKGEVAPRTPVYTRFSRAHAKGTKAAEAYGKEIGDEAKTTCGLLLDSPNGAGTGGSTDGANNARDFFSEELREKVLDLFKVDARDRAKLKQILR